ncbi:MAG: lipoyl(octanoyl) transferase LipB [Chloroflexi bacterium]|nr:lipoyl(octanoyl) transferase LipB [Chloroflexota bacterium]
MTPPLNVHVFGIAPYAEVWALQEQLADARLAGRVPDSLLLLEHPPTITLGRRGSLADVYASPEALARRGVTVERTSRGGLVTFHGPGQLVGYPIVHLRGLGRTVPAYVHGLESAMVRALSGFGIAAWEDTEHPGVWTAGGKVAAIGIAQRRGVTLHGFALNVDPDLSYFELINPCGLGGLGVTSIARLVARPPTLAAVRRSLVRCLIDEFGWSGEEDHGIVPPLDTISVPEIQPN